ncbi:MAG TPA: DPP IV N-terminal domain-containing protein, partial [Thermomonas sp.]|nr:DPP IV N-terminal domain-containing protein [Thermomonas sp.]
MDAKQVVLGALLMAGAGTVAAQSVTAADYARAAGMLGDRTGPLVDHAVSGAQWLDDGSLVYREQADGKVRVLRFDPATGKTAPAFDAQALAAAMNAAGGGKARTVQADKLPPLKISRNADGSLALSGMAGGFRCDAAGCQAVAKARTAAGDEPGAPSPDGTREAFIRGWNLWLRDVASGKETQLTFDGQPDYGYATDNAGWKHTDNA